MENAHAPGNKIGQVVYPSLRACIERCHQISACIFVTFETSSGICRFKDANAKLFLVPKQGTLFASKNIDIRNYGKSN